MILVSNYNERLNMILRIRLAPIFEHCLVKNLRFFDQLEPKIINTERVAGPTQEDFHKVKHRLDLEVGLNRRLKDALDFKNEESIRNLVDKPISAKFFVQVAIPTRNHTETFCQEIQFPGFTGKLGVGYGSKNRGTLFVPYSGTLFVPYNRAPCSFPKTSS